MSLRLVQRLKVCFWLSAFVFVWILVSPQPRLLVGQMIPYNPPRFPFPDAESERSVGYGISIILVCQRYQKQTKSPTMCHQGFPQCRLQYRYPQDQINHLVLQIRTPHLASRIASFQIKKNKLFDIPQRKKNRTPKCTHDGVLKSYSCKPQNHGNLRGFFWESPCCHLKQNFAFHLRTVFVLPYALHGSGHQNGWDFLFLKDFVKGCVRPTFSGKYKQHLL